MRRRLFIAVGLFGLALAVLFGVLGSAIYYRAEDAAFDSLLQQAEADIPLSPRLEDLAPELRTQINRLPLGRHEIDLEFSELHVSVSTFPAGGRKVTILRIPESAARETVFNLALWFTVALAISTALGLASLLVHRTVRPIEQLTDRLRQGDPKLPAPELADPELALLAEALDAHLIQRETQMRRERAFLREASHELRTPLTTIRAVCELATGRHSKAEEIARIQRSATRMEHTIEGLLALARSDQAISLTSFPDEILALTDEFRENAGTALQLETQIEWEPREPLAARLLVLALATLLRNITDHASATKVSICLDDKRLTVLDNGTGIRNLDAVRLALTSGHPLPGGGLGLSIVERISRRMEWSFTNKNLPSGGLCSTLTFPHEELSLPNYDPLRS